MIALLFGLSAFAQGLPHVEPGRELDFWIGRWNVYVGKELAGTDVVEKQLNGFAVTEKWKGVEAGDVGESFFYYMPAKKQWTQVWVTGVGPYKEKYSEAVEGGVRFVGHAFMPRGKVFGDRTTLTKMPDGSVHQVIESSVDGKTWKIGFDAIYRRAKA